MYEVTVWGDAQANQITNVALVPQRSPFRYPGGKTWLVPRIRQWLNSQPMHPTELIEPFAGGGIVSLTAAFEGLVDKVTMVELDHEVAAVWQTIINGDGERLADEIASFNLTAQSVQTSLAETGGTTTKVAFRTILKNRVNRGGILAPGAGLVKNGENGKGLLSRWYPETLRKRIIDIIRIRDRINFIEGDGIEVLKQNAQRPDAVSFIDPPYTAAGKKAGSRLYTHSELDHEELFKIAGDLAGDFLMTYDNTEEVYLLAKRYNFDTLLVAMKNTHHARMNELLIGRNLDWARQPPIVQAQFNLS